MSWSLLFTFSGCKFSCCSFSTDNLMACILYLFAFWLEGSVVYCAFLKSFILTTSLIRLKYPFFDTKPDMFPFNSGVKWKNHEITCDLIINLPTFILSHKVFVLLYVGALTEGRHKDNRTFATHYFLCHSSDDFCSLCTSFYISASSVKKKYWLTPILTQKCW